MTTSFEGVNGLSVDEQRRLFETGDAPERLWAAWALALALGADAVPLLASLQQRDASEGLRRQVLVVLAGLGERELLRTIALHDPAVSLQATATTLYLRTASAVGVPEVVAFAAEQLRHARADVRVAVLDEVGQGRLLLPLVEVLPALTDPSAAVREACLALLAPAFHVEEPVVSALIDALLEEAESSLRRAMIEALPADALPRVFSRMAERRPRELAPLIRFVRACRGALAWREVQEAAHAAAMRADEEALAAILDTTTLPPLAEGLQWLCAVLRFPTLRWRPLEIIRGQLDADLVRALSPEARDLLQVIFREELDRLKADESEDEDDDGDDDDAWDREPLIADAERLLALLA